MKSFEMDSHSISLSLETKPLGPHFLQFVLLPYCVDNLVVMRIKVRRYLRNY